MQLDKLTFKSQEALQEAQRIAREHSHQEMDGEHLALALIGQSESLIPDLLKKIGVPVARLKPNLEGELARRHKVQGAGEAYAGNNFKKSLDAAQSEAAKLKDDYISTEHLLLGLMDEGGASLKKIFSSAGLKRDLVLKALAELRGNQRVTDQNPEEKFQALEKYGRDLTPHEKQPRAHRRTGGGQDGDCRRSGTAHRQRRRSRIAQEQTPRCDGPGCDDCRRKVPRRIRGPVQSVSEGDCRE